MEVIGIIFLLIVGFIVLGVTGWIVKFIGLVVEFLFEGIGNLFQGCMGCLVWMFLIVFGIVCLSMLI